MIYRVRYQPRPSQPGTVLLSLGTMGTRVLTRGESTREHLPPRLLDELMRTPGLFIEEEEPAASAVQAAPDDEGDTAEIFAPVEPEAPKKKPKSRRASAKEE